ERGVVVATLVVAAAVGVLDGAEQPAVLARDGRVVREDLRLGHAVRNSRGRTHVVFALVLHPTLLTHHAHGDWGGARHAEHDVLVHADRARLGTRLHHVLGLEAELEPGLLGGDRLRPGHD